MDYMVIFDLFRLRGKKMFKRATVILLMLVSISVLVIAAFAISGNNSSNNIASNVGAPLSTISNNSTSTVPESPSSAPNHHVITNVKDEIISPTAAKILAKKYIEQPGAIPGTPQLVKQDGKKVYIVPVIDKKKNVGEIYLDAQSGKNLGGAGGAPSN
jgi:hypothetical protein